MPATADQKCETCRFWERKSIDSGECHRYPGQALPYIGQKFWLPMAPADQWCGEWKQARQE